MRGAILASAKSFPGGLFVYPYPVSGAERSEPSQTDNLNPGAAMGSRDGRIWPGCLVFGLAACLFYLVIEIYLLGGELGFPLDDSWIHLQFARNLFAGNGLSFNPEVLVPGSTAPLWTALLSLIFFLPGNPLFWTKLFGVVLYLAGGVVTYRLSRELGLDPWPANLAAAVTLATSWLVWSALSGLEISLFIVLSLAGILFHIRERRDPARIPVSLPILALGFLARPEAALLILAAVADRLLVFRLGANGQGTWHPPRWRDLLVGLAIAAVIVAPVLVFNFSVTGSILPTTFGAKSGGLARWLPEMGYLYTVFGIFFQAQPWMALFAAAGALILLADLGTQRNRGLLPILWLFGLPFAYGLIDPPGKYSLVGNFGRYYFPLFPIVVILGILAVQPVARRLARWVKVGFLGIPLRLVAVLVLLAPTLTELAQGAGRYAQGVVNVQDSDVRAARWLAHRLPPEAVLGVGDIGAIKYLLPNQVIDLAGIANPEIKTWGAVAFLEHYKPDYLVIFPNWLDRLIDDVSAFQAVHEIPIANNITMAGDVLVVYKTPWTRYPLVEPANGAKP
jgi:hypothetical protein